MVLKRIEIFGFKSFPDKTVLDFPEGITAIVGANGCGKSNISDAIRWVLGEQSAKSLRGDHMEDLIFAGTAARKPLNLAEVILTFDNSRGLFNVPFTEVSIGRRLFRDGQSNYLLNKQECRLRDIYDLLMDSGIGRRVHAIIEQGKIDEIVTAKPEERRGIIEEAAGIAKYRSRRTEALRRLESTREGMRRIDDIIAEMDRQESSLRRAAKKAEKFREVETELRLLELSHSAARRRELRAAITQLSDRKRTLTDAITALDAEMAALALKIETEKTAEEDARLRQKECAAALSEAEKAASAAESQMAELRERQADDERSLVRFGAEIDHLTGRIAEARATCDAAGDAASLLAESAASLGSARASARAEASDQAARLASARGELDEIVRQRAALQETLARLESESAYLERSRAALEERRIRLAATAVRLREENDRLRAQAAIHENERTASGLEKDCRVAEETMVRERIESCDGEIAAVADAISLAERELAVAASRHAASVAGAAAVGEMLAAASMEHAALRSVSDAVAFDAAHLAAFASALGEALRGVLVSGAGAPGNGAIDRVADRLRGRTIFPATASVASAEQAWSPRAGLTPLRDLLPVDAAPAIRSYLAGWYYAAASEEATAAAAAIGECERVVTATGDVHFSFGAVRKFRSEEADEGAVGRDALEAEMEKSRSEIAELSDRLEARRKERAIAIAELESVRLRLREIEARRSELNALLAGIAERLADDGEAGIDSESRKIDGEARSIGDRRVRLDEESRSSHAASVDLDFRRAQLLERVAAEEAEQDRLRARAAELEIEESRSRERLAAKEAEVRQIRAWLDESVASLARYEDMRAEIMVRRERLAGVAAELEARVADLAIRLDACRTAYAQSETAVRDVEARRSALDHESRSAQKRKDGSVAESHELDMEAVRVTGEETMILERIREKYHVDLADEACVIEPNTAPAAAARIEELREMMERMSGVNFAAAEELDELLGRLGTYRAQREDLLRAETGLVEVVTDIDKRTIALFNETFRAVNTNFGLLFNRLFGAKEGLTGSAELVLLDPEHPLESGIDIVAMPPGKKPQTISLLSGGEKALTAVSLLFAVFLVRPSPFAVLDELDAPLDEANVGKYAQLLKEFSQRSQFIIITHNKRTMEVAGTMYGVTQMEKGISKILGVRLEDTSEEILEAVG